MRSFSLAPAAFDALHRWDKAALRYWTIVNNYYEERALERARKETEAARSYRQSLPRLKRR